MFWRKAGEVSPACSLRRACATVGLWRDLRGSLIKLSPVRGWNQKQPPRSTFTVEVKQSPDKVFKPTKCIHLVKLLNWLNRSKCMLLFSFASHWPLQSQHNRLICGVTISEESSRCDSCSAQFVHYSHWPLMTRDGREECTLKTLGHDEWPKMHSELLTNGTRQAHTNTQTRAHTHTETHSQWTHTKNSEWRWIALTRTLARAEL